MEPLNIKTFYSVPLSKPEDSIGETPIYRNPQALKELTTSIKRLPQVKTLQDLHEYAGKAFATCNCLGTRTRQADGTLGEYSFNTYQSTYDTARKVGSAILNLDLAPVVQGEGGLPDYRMVALYSKNRPEWITTDIACCLYGITVIPIFDALAGDALSHIFEQTGCTTIFTAEANVDKFLQNAVDGKMSKLKNIVCLTSYTPAQKETAMNGGFNLIAWEEFLSHGETVLPYPQVSPDTLFSISYTSGTTGNQKAAVLSHGNILSVIAGSEEHDAKGIDFITGRDVYLSHLPMAHAFERGTLHIILSRGVTIGISSGDPRKLTDDMQALKPTFITGVPLIMNRIYENLKAQVEKLTNDPSADITKVDTTIKNQLKEVVGGRLRMILTAGAPVAPHVQQYLRSALMTAFSQSFGQTEAVNSVFAQSLDDTSADNVGGILTHLEFKLVDVPDLGYTSKDKGPHGEPMPRGEVCLRGGSVFKGYFKEPAKTAEILDEQGWSHTGDIAVLLPNGSVRIIDRKKNILKLAQGEYIAPDMIENVYKQNKYVTEVFVYGDPFQTRTVAIVVPNQERLEALGQELGLRNLSFEELCADSKVVEFLLDDLKKTCRSAKLLGYEIPYSLHLEPKSFATHGLLTSLNKFKRNAAAEHFETVIKKLYTRKVA